jgi:hypothetical protein
MDLIDYLFRMDLDKLKKIALHLETLPDVNIVNRQWIVSLITDILLNKDKLRRRVFNKVQNETIVELVKYVFTKRPISTFGIQELTNYGLAFNGEIPNDIQMLICKQCRSLAVVELNNEKYKTKHTPFLRFIQLINFFKDKDVVNYNFKKPQISLKKIIDELALFDNESERIKQSIDFLIVKGFIKREKNKLYFNFEKYNSWVRQDSILSIRDFYKQYKNSNNLSECLENISHLQELECEWVRVNYLSQVTLGIEIAKNYGLIRATLKNNIEFVQLTPEGWFLIKGDSPKCWLEKVLLVSADFELFIPHTYDPFFLLDITRFCTLKQNEYFMVYNINPSLNKDEDGHIKYIEMFINTIKRKSRYIPNVVEYDFLNELKKPIS